MSFLEKGKARANLARARKVVRKAKRVTPERVAENRKLNTRDSMVSAETVKIRAQSGGLLVLATTQVSWQGQRHGQVEIQCHRDQRKRHEQTS